MRTYLSFLGFFLDELSVLLVTSEHNVSLCIILSIVASALVFIKAKIVYKWFALCQIKWEKDFCQSNV